MKKNAIIIILLTALLFSIISAASASGSNEDYYLKISCALGNIDYALLHGNPEEAEVWMTYLRTSVYEAAKFLAANKTYDARLMEGLRFASKAFANQADYELVIHFISLAFVFFSKLSILFKLLDLGAWNFL